MMYCFHAPSLLCLVATIEGLLVSGSHGKSNAVKAKKTTEEWQTQTSISSKHDIHAS